MTLTDISNLSHQLLSRLWNIIRWRDIKLNAKQVIFFLHCLKWVKTTHIEVEPSVVDTDDEVVSSVVLLQVECKLTSPSVVKYMLLHIIYSTVIKFDLNLYLKSKWPTFISIVNHHTMEIFKTKCQTSHYVPAVFRRSQNYSHRSGTFCCGHGGWSCSLRSTPAGRMLIKLSFRNETHAFAYYTLNSNILWH